MEYVGGPKVIKIVFVKEGGRQNVREGDVMMKAEVGVMQRRGHEPRNAGGLWKLENARKFSHGTSEGT